MNIPGWVGLLNLSVLAGHRTRLAGGYDEPFYKANCADGWAEIRFNRDYERSALHELAHWCVAGSERRRLDDYGYWYAPDGRDNHQQQAFFRVEVLPQAIERHFCTALGIAFAVSIDNLGNQAIEGAGEFAAAVAACYQRLDLEGLPARAAQIHHCLTRWQSQQP